MSPDNLIPFFSSGGDSGNYDDPSVGNSDYGNRWALYTEKNLGNNKWKKGSCPVANS